MRRWIVPAAIFVIMALTHTLYLVSLRSSAVISESDGAVTEFVKGRVVRLLDTKVFEQPSSVNHMLEVELLGGRFKGKRIVLRNVIRPLGLPLMNRYISAGDVILCRVSGEGDKLSAMGLIQEYSRDGFIIYMTGGLLMLIVLVGRVQGVRNAFALIFSGLAIYFIMLPMLRRGIDPILSVCVTSAAIAIVALLMIIGPNRKSFSAILGTIGGVLISVLLVIYAQKKLYLTGMATANVASILEALAKTQYDFGRLLLGGMIIGVLGVAMDASIDVASAMDEIKRADPDITPWRLIRAGMNVGTDVLGTMSNTLVFAYFGLRLLLVMASLGTKIFAQTWMQLLSVEVISAEVVRILAGSIGMVMTIPLTALIAGFWYCRKPKPKF
ncbi:hypothetical protein DRP77_02980 [Candidatus Poribacteria bacterium]|nr:MAG: hypothetical protein DRP77_02980 [Candidatus Poribacteria bacterium]